MFASPLHPLSEFTRSHNLGHKNCHSSKLHQKFHTLWMMCLLDFVEIFPSNVEYFLSFLDLNGILMEMESEAKRQNHIVIKSKAIDLFPASRSYFVWLCRCFCPLIFIHQRSCNSEKRQKMSCIPKYSVDSTQNFFQSWWYLHNLSTSVVRIIFMTHEKKTFFKNKFGRCCRLRVRWSREKMPATNYLDLNKQANRYDDPGG